MTELSQGTVHTVPTDLEAALRADPGVMALWERLTPLGRNEFICWVEDAKQAKTRERRIGRTTEELREGKGRPCCWPGCIHRTDKAPSRWQQAVLIDGKRLRDEARSANEAQPTRRAIDIGKSPLDEIEGVGPGRKTALLHAFGSAKGVGRASVVDLEKVEGINRALAERIYGFFQKA